MADLTIDDWTLIGAQMVVLHGLELRVPRTRRGVDRVISVEFEWSVQTARMSVGL